MARKKQTDVCPRCHSPIQRRGQPKFTYIDYIKRLRKGGMFVVPDYRKWAMLRTAAYKCGLREDRQFSVRKEPRGICIYRIT